jgi:predicted GIY-YIG superfamily endonuclease
LNINKTFARLHIDSLEKSFQKLIEMPPISVANLPINMPISGVYLFTENGKPLYVGRSNTIRKRLQNHCRPSSSSNSAAFAFKLTRKITDQITTKITRAALEKDPKFAGVFLEQKARIKKMNVSYVAEFNPITQAILEMYVAVRLNTPYNDFDNH